MKYGNMQKGYAFWLRLKSPEKKRNWKGGFKNEGERKSEMKI